MGTGSIFDVLRLNFLTFLGKEVLSEYLSMCVQHGFVYRKRGQNSYRGKNDTFENTAGTSLHPTLFPVCRQSIRILDNLSDIKSLR